MHLSDDTMLEILQLHELGCDVLEIARIVRCTPWEAADVIARDEAEFPCEPLRDRVLH